MASAERPEGLKELPSERQMDPLPRGCHQEDHSHPHLRLSEQEARRSYRPAHYLQDVDGEISRWWQDLGLSVLLGLSEPLLQRR